MLISDLTGSFVTRAEARELFRVMLDAPLVDEPEEEVAIEVLREEWGMSPEAIAAQPTGMRG
jgi:hypothetical protein